MRPLCAKPLLSESSSFHLPVPFPLRLSPCQPPIGWGISNGAHPHRRQACGFAWGEYLPDATEVLKCGKALCYKCRHISLIIGKEAAQVFAGIGCLPRTSSLAGCIFTKSSSEATSEKQDCSQGTRDKKVSLVELLMGMSDKASFEVNHIH